MEELAGPCHEPLGGDMCRGVISGGGGVEEALSLPACMKVDLALATGE
jgi:hypothetical protein